jgi:hypothetical protein
MYASKFALTCANYISCFDHAAHGNDIFCAKAAFAALAVRDTSKPAAFGAPSIELFFAPQPTGPGIQ